MYQYLDLHSLHSRILSGDEAAEVELYWWLQNHRGLLCGRERLSRSEDVATHVWMQLIRYIRGGAVHQPNALITIAEIIAYRHRKHSENRESRYVELCVGISKADNAPTAIELIYQKERRAIVNSAIEKLSPRKKEIIHRYLNGQPLEQIAAEMQLTDTQLRLSKSRAVEDIRKHIHVKHKTRSYSRKANDHNHNPNN